MGDPVDLGTARLDGPMRFGLVSDTHIPESRPELWPEVFEAFRGVDAIIHGGDLHQLSVLEALAEVAPVYAARGNGEDGSAGRPITPDHPQLRLGWLLDVGAVRVGVVHDLPIPEHPPNLTVDRWCQRYFGTADVDVIVYGHTHVEAIDVVGTTLCVNPGSPTYPHNLDTQLGTVATMDIDGDVVRPQVWQLTDGGLAPFAGIQPVEHVVARRLSPPDR